MDEAANSPGLQWPDVPACYGWLGLDRRGRWRLRGEPVLHAGLEAFLRRHYGHDAGGNWLVQNGPQTVYVALDYTPWVLRLDGEQRLLTHTGLAVGALSEALLDEEGNLLLVTEHGPGLLDDRDLAVLLAGIFDGKGRPATEADLAALLAGRCVALQLLWQGQALPLRPIRRDAVAIRFGFVPLPTP